MALARTDIGVFESKSAFGTPAFTTSEFTPPANSLLVVTVFFIGNGASGDMGTPTVSGGGLTYTPKVTAFGSAAWAIKIAMFTAPVGSSPAKMALTVDDDNNQSIDAYTVSAVAYTGYDTKTPVGGTATSGSTNTGDGEEKQTLSEAPAVGDATLLAIGNDTSTGPPKATLAAGWVKVHEGKLSGEGGLELAQRLESTSTEVKVTDVHTAGGSFAKGMLVSLVIKAATGGGGGKALTLELSDSAAFSESRGAGDSKAAAEALALAESMMRDSGLGRADAMAIADALGRAPGVGVGEQQVLADTLARAFGLSPADALTTADALVRRAELAPSEVLDVEDLLATAWSTRRQLAEQLTAGDVSAAAAAKSLLESAAFGDATRIAAARAEREDLGLLDLLELTLQRVVEDALGLSESSVRSLGLGLADTLALLDQLEGTGTAGVALEEVLRLGEWHQLAVGRTATDSAALADAVAKSTTRGSADAVSISDARRAAVGRVQADGVSLAESIAKSSTRVQTDAIVFSESVGKGVGAKVADGLAVVEGLARQALKFVADLLGLSDATEADAGETELPAYLVLVDAPATALAVVDWATTALTLIDQPATDLVLLHQPTTYLTLEDEPHV